MASGNIESKVQNLLEKIINELGYDLYDVIYEKEGKDYYLRIIIDKESGIDINDCEKVNNAINDILDEADLIKDQYYLEVSSPGVERTLRKDKHYLNQIGNEVLIKLYKPIEKKKEIQGILEEYLEDEIVIRTDDNQRCIINKKDIALAKTIYNW